ncbi:MAG: hypothetical protein AB1609_07825 [Bacillota bacterium]
MFQVSPEDVLRGLKRFKRLAKQDILAASKTPNPRFWNLHAEARRKVYDALMQAIEQAGLESAYELARRQFAELARPTRDDPEQHGQEQALTLFFQMLGMTDEQIAALPQQEPVPQETANPSVAVN